MTDELIEDQCGTKMTPQREYPGLHTCNCGSGLVPESVYLNKKLIGFHCRRCVRNYDRRG
jgi:hypothetical protein